MPSVGRVRSVMSPRGHLGQVDRLGLASALVQVGTRTATRTLPRRAAALGLEMAKIAVGKSSVSPDGKDWRFKNRAWQQNPAFHRLGQAYLAWSRTTMDLVGDADLDWRTEERAKLAASLLTSTLAPTNVLPLNPDAIERAYETGGRSVVSGLGNMIRDVRTNRGMPRSVDPDAFVVGRDLGITPGAVVFRNEVCELIQYAPMTETVRTTPVVLVPPQINKYYFMDMAPGRSLVEYVVKQGYQMFVISWRNPTSEHRQWNLDAYVEAVRDALRATCEITGSPEVNTLSLCSGGITTAALLGHLAATGERLIHCATFAVTLLDFSVPSLIGLFGSEKIVRNALRASERTGVVGGPESRTLFAMLRPNDLIFNYWVANNLLGDAHRPSTSWPGTPTPPASPPPCMPTSSTCSSTIRWPSGTFSVFGEPIDLGRVTCDTFVVGARNDHLTDWKACYATTQLLGGDSQFALSSSGHIQSLVNPPGNPKMTVATGPERGPDPEAWLASCQPVTGSWWESWAAWASTRSGPCRPVSHRLGSPCHPAGEPAPGQLRARLMIEPVPAVVAGRQGSRPMMDLPLNAWLLFDNAPTHAPHAELVSRTPTGVIERQTYADFGRRAQQLMHALDGLGLERGDRVATLAWNSARHLEAYFGVPCSGRVLHTLNVRLSPEDLAYMISDAGDRAVLVDADLLPLLEEALTFIAPIDHVIVLGRRGARRLDSGRHRLRGSHRRPAGPLPAARHRRVGADGNLLHVGDHRAPEGSRVLPPLHVPPRVGGDVARRHVDRTRRLRPAPGPDVPCQRLGDALRGHGGRGQAGLFRRCSRSSLLHRPPGGGAGHRGRRRAHGLAGHRR